MHTPPPRKKLPVNPSLEHLQKQAKRRVKQNPSLQLTAAQHQLAQEYGCKNWAELTLMIASMAHRLDPALARGERYAPLPKAARARDFEHVRRLLDAGAYTPNTLDQALAHVLWYGDPTTWPERKAAADLLLEYGADPDGQYGSGGYGPIVFGTGECVQPEGLLYLIAAGADVSFPPLRTKYGWQCPLSYILGTYGRGANDRKHRYLEILLAHQPFIPAEITPPVLAIHRGDARLLGELVEREPELLSRRLPDLPYGNIALRGATLLHCAVEFGENECVETLLRHGADLNAPSDLIGGVGGQTPVFHAIHGKLGTLHLLTHSSARPVDLSIRATFRRHGEIQASPVTVLEFAEHSGASAEAMALLRSVSPRKTEN